MSNSLKSALYTFLFTFVGAVAVLSLGWLQQLAQWASSNGHAPLPGLSVIGYAVVSAFVSAAGGLIAFVVRYLQTKNVIPGSPPVYGPTPAPAPVVSPTDADATLAQLMNLKTSADLWDAVKALATGAAEPPVGT